MNIREFKKVLEEHFDQYQSFYKNIVIPLLVVVMFGVFYLSQNLYRVDNGNDFGEYFVRAEFWADGIFAWFGGSDKLLSLVELVAIKISNINDFFDIYHHINELITILLFISIFAFLTTPNPFTIKKEIKLLSVIFLLTIPFFIIEGRTVDQSFLFGVMLILWVSVYHQRILSPVVALLVFVARPEGALIIPLYLLVIWTDNINRKRIVENFIGFLLILFIYKVIDGYLSPPSASYQEYDGLRASLSVTNFTQANLFSIIIHLMLLPVDYFLSAMIVLKSLLYFSLFFVGTLISLKDKKYYLYLGIPILFLLEKFALTPYTIIDYESLRNHIATSSNLLFYPISSFASAPYFGHERYLLFLYPFFSIFVIKGLVYLCQLIPLIRHELIVGSLVIITISNSYVFLETKSRFQFDQPNRVVSYFPVDAGVVIRKSKTSITNSVVIYNFCEGSMGSNLSTFSVFSGIANIYTKACQGSSAWSTASPKSSSPIRDSTELKQVNGQLNFKFIPSAVDYEFTVNNKLQINKLFQTPTATLLKSLSINFVITKYFPITNYLLLDKEIQLISIVNGYKIYRVI